MDDRVQGLRRSVLYSGINNFIYLLLSHYAVVYINKYFYSIILCKLLDID